MAKKTKSAKSTSDDIKNIRLYVPIDLYNKLRKHQAKGVLQNKPYESLHDICLKILEKGTKGF